MRFSSLFHKPLTPRAAAVALQPARVEQPLVPIAVAAASPDSELPEALDERVRLVGEWQLGDA